MPLSPRGAPAAARPALPRKPSPLRTARAFSTPWRRTELEPRPVDPGVRDDTRSLYRLPRLLPRAEHGRCFECRVSLAPSEAVARARSRATWPGELFNRRHRPLPTRRDVRGVKPKGSTVSLMSKLTGRSDMERLPV